MNFIEKKNKTKQKNKKKKQKKKKKKKKKKNKKNKKKTSLQYLDHTMFPSAQRWSSKPYSMHHQSNRKPHFSLLMNYNFCQTLDS